jgi:hypothetical protein
MRCRGWGLEDAQRVEAKSWLRIAIQAKSFAVNAGW